MKQFAAKAESDYTFLSFHTANNDIQLLHNSTLSTLHTPKHSVCVLELTVSHLNSSIALYVFHHIFEREKLLSTLGQTTFTYHGAVCKNFE